MMWKSNGKTKGNGTGELTAFIDEASEIDGKFTFSGTVMINGRLRGEIHSNDTLIVGEKGVINASIRAGVVLVSGEVVSPAEGMDGRINAFAVVTLPVETADREVSPVAFSSSMFDQCPAARAVSWGFAAGSVPASCESDSVVAAWAPASGNASGMTSGDTGVVGDAARAAAGADTAVTGVWGFASSSSLTSGVAGGTTLLIMVVGFIFFARYRAQIAYWA